ncbi:3-hydroxyphenylacetate 6-hydroxylase [Talaromyces islandicus]|uniref:3-hydroxyphenylacetate 6-hydroxylase n=1 Tax=Talaromyces islandicus TaxID=28573 RepID=A0A0U1M9J9_TALIS|nr:3-hydroxyphenylacetate 6-hydroxylase [Talaromyces islandicus]
MEVSLFNITTIRYLQGIAGIIAAFFLINEVYRWSVRIKGIPGPRGIPLLGNLRQITNTSPPEQYRLWSLKYGPLFQVQLGNVPILIINSAEVAKSLLIRESAAFNSRPLFYVFHKFVSKEITSIGTSPWDESCKKRRKAAASALNVIQVDSYAPVRIVPFSNPWIPNFSPIPKILRLESSEFIEELKQACNNGKTAINFVPFARRFSMNLSLTLNYGTRASDQKSFDGNPLINEINAVESEVGKYRSTSSNIKNYVPLFRLLDPLMMTLPGNSLQRALDIGRRRLRYHATLLDTLKSEISKNEDKPCIQGNMLKNPDTKNLTDLERLSVSLSIMAGADSNTPTVAWGITFLAHNPTIQKKAFQEIKKSGVLESDPFGNGKVPYVDAVTKELSRYYTILRLAMPKEVTEPVVYNGVTIPKGTMIMLNSWACNHDEALFAEPFSFLPERWLQNEDSQAHQFAFGMGSRMCVASHLAHKALYLVFLHLIAHFEILPSSSDEPWSIADPIDGARDGATVSTPPKNDSPVAITQHQTISTPQSLRSLQLPRVLPSNNAAATRGPAEDTLFELYYENFHRTHPILLPKRVYDSGHQYPRSPLRTLATTDLIQIPENNHSLPVIQSKLLFAIVLYSDGEVDEARKWLSEAIRVAVSLGMNKKSFADFYRVQQGADLEAESARRTWWELYVLDGLISALDHRGVSNFNMSIIPCDVEMPCEEVIYAEGKPIPPPSSRQELESRIFNWEDDEEENVRDGYSTVNKSRVLSSFTYRVDAIDLLAQVLAVRDPNRAHRDKTQAVDNTLASWAHYLPTSKADIVNAYGEIDEMLLQAHMMVQLAVILLHFPRSNLALDCSSLNGGNNDINLLYGLLSQKLPPSSTRHIHGIKATEASKRLSNLFSLCTSMQKHSPLFMFSLALCGVVQLATYCNHARLDGSVSCLDQHRARVRLIVGLLKSSNETWPLSKKIQRSLRKVAANTFHMKKPDVLSTAITQPSSNEASDILHASAEQEMLFHLESENVWMPMDGQYDLPELAPWVWG